MCNLPKADKKPEWSPEVQAKAEEILSLWVEKKKPFSSLVLKNILRANLSPEEKIVQKDTSRFLRKWWYGTGKKDGYKFVEMKEPVLHYEFQSVEPPHPHADLIERADKMLDGDYTDTAIEGYRDMIEDLLVVVKGKK